MNKILFTSDTHFHHKSIMKFCPNTRKNATSVEHMNEMLIEQWNQQVGNMDTVYHLGDFSFGDEKETGEILDRLNGKIHLILGNHDRVIRTSSSLQSRFSTIQEYLDIKIDKKAVVMFHFPIYEWNKMHYGSYHLYGHVHGGVKIEGRAQDVGIDAREQGDMKLWTWEEIDAILSLREVRTHHGKTKEL